MARTVSFPLSVGRKDSVDPKLAPLGVLATCKNLRVRKDGRLACRNGYQPLDMRVGATDTLKAYDLHEFNGRLLAFGTSKSGGFPQQPFEYTGIGANTTYWTHETNALELTPFVDLKNIIVASPPAAGVDMVDCAAGGGYVLTVYRSGGNVRAVVVRESDNQPILTELISSTQSTRQFRCTYSDGSFYVLSIETDNSGDLLQFTPATMTAFTNLVTAFAANATAISAFDIATVENQTASTSRVVVCRDRGATTNLLVRAYSAAGVQVGSDIATSIAGDSIGLAICSDRTANQIHILQVLAASSSLYTFNFAGTLLNGPTALSHVATHGGICRIPPSAAILAEAQVGVVYSDAAGDSYLELFAEDNHAATSVTEINSVVALTRPIPWTFPTGTSQQMYYPVVFGGYVSPVIGSTDDATNALFYVDIGPADGAHMATRDYLNAIPGTFRNAGMQLDSSTGRVVWAAMRDGGSGAAQPAVTTFSKHSTARRQTAKFGNLLYIAGAPLQVYDGRCLIEPFQEVPGIVSLTASNGAGALSPLGTYEYVLHWECTLADGSYWQSAPSNPASVTLGASDDTVTIVSSAPHALVQRLGLISVGAEITIVVSRIVWDAVNSVGGSTYRQSVTKSALQSGYGHTTSIVDVTSDATLATRGAVYTQAERGNLSGLLEHNAPRVGQYVAASESRLYMAGQLNSNQFQVSKEAFFGEPFTFSEFSTFQGQVAGSIRGVYSLDGARLFFTADEIFAIDGGGPDDLGGGGLSPPVRIPTPSGLEDWRSFLEEPAGLWFQLDDGKLYMLPRGGSAPVWLGVDIQDTLASFPVITGACKSRRDDALLFACQNTSAGTDARIIVRSMRTGIWTEDTPPLQASSGIAALTAYGDSVAYASGGTVYVQSTSSFADGTSTVIPTQGKTQPLYPFGVGNTGLIHDLLIDGEFRSAGTLALRVSYNDGVAFDTLGSFVLSGLTVGETVQRQWALPVVGARSLVLEWTFTPSVAGEGFIAKSATLLVTADEGLPPLLPTEVQ